MYYSCVYYSVWIYLKKTFFKIEEQFKGFFFFQFIVEKNDRLKLCDNSETRVEEIIF